MTIKYIITDIGIFVKKQKKILNMSSNACTHWILETCFRTFRWVLDINLLINHFEEFANKMSDRFIKNRHELIHLTYCNCSSFCFAKMDSIFFIRLSMSKSKFVFVVDQIKLFKGRLLSANDSVSSELLLSSVKYSIQEVYQLLGYHHLPAVLI